MRKVKIGKRYVGEGEPVYTIAEIGSNFNRSIEKAKKLVDLAKECGADAAKFQSFEAKTIVSPKGFSKREGFQSKWKKPVYDVYKDAEFPLAWHAELKEYCDSKGIDFVSAPYNFQAADLLEEIGVDFYKIGSGDITYLELVEHIAKKRKPVVLGVGASNMGEIEDAVKAIRGTGNNDIVLLQCITNYPTNFESANIRAMRTLADAFDVPVGYSDHTPGSVVPLGAVALGGCMIEKHFTDDKRQEGPDHNFAMDAKDFKEMVQSIRNLEKALGTSIKDLTEDEKRTVVLQRRSLYAAVDIKKGDTIKKEMITELRPAEGIPPKYKKTVIGRKAKNDIEQHTPIRWEDV